MWNLYVGLEERIVRIAKENTRFPPNAVVAFSIGEGRCPEKWREVTELRGRFIVGAGQGNDLDLRSYGQPGGFQTVTLKVENLPPHRHQVYRHAGEIVGSSSGINGAGSEDSTLTSRVRESLSGSGTDLNGKEALVAAPVKIMPPYFAYTFCRPEER
jgi:hypothetical protein